MIYEFIFETKLILVHKIYYFINFTQKLPKICLEIARDILKKTGQGKLGDKTFATIIVNDKM